MLKHFNLMGTPLQSLIGPWGGVPSGKETELYHYVKRNASKERWKYVRIENKFQNGFPDMLLLKGPLYCFIEAKVCRKAVLKDIKEDLEWQIGQLGFFYECVKMHLSYVLMVRHKTTLYYITGANSETENFPDFIRRAGMV